MSLTVVSEIWKIIKPSIEVGDSSSAAELLVNYLVDHDYDRQEIKTLFKRDPEVQEALSFYLEKPEDSLVALEEQYDDDDDVDDYDYDDDYDDDY
jgi:hypothetical protein